MTKPISEHSTPRKCSICLKPASIWNFTANKFGGINKSTKTPRCVEHGETE
jgi:hypothetical protein